MKLKRLINYLFENIEEAMQLEPPSGYIIEIGGDQRVIFIKMIKNNPPEGKRGRVKGYIKIERGITVPGGGMIWEVSNVEAESGYGPLLYDLAMEMVYLLDDGRIVMIDYGFTTGVAEEYYWKSSLDPYGSPPPSSIMSDEEPRYS